MKKISELYEIRIAQESDIDQIMSFIDCYWKKGHICAVDREFFEYEFLEEDGTVNFVLAINKESGEIEGLEGFLKASRTDNPDVWTSFWKVTDGSVPLLGTEIRKKLDELSRCRYSIGIGDNPLTTVPLMKKVFKRKTARMQQFYILANRNDYKIADIRDKNIKTIDEYKAGDIVEINSIVELESFLGDDDRKKAIPYKDAYYYKHRFFDNPIYKYQVFGICEKCTINAFFIFREQSYEDRKVIRIVDFVGDQRKISNMVSFINGMLKGEEYEYADFYCYGFDKDCLTEAGFVERIEGDCNIIPNYFNPFLRENVEIYVDYEVDGTIFCKGDSDQDRPVMR